MSTSSPIRTARPVCFVDVETTGLNPRIHEAWEIAVIRREQDGHEYEHLWQIAVSLETADPEALKIGRHAERFCVPDGWDAVRVNTDGSPAEKLHMPELLYDLAEALSGATLVGSNPAFDDGFLKKLMHAYGRKVTWHYRTVDIATLAAGHLYGQAAEMTRQHCDATFYGRVGDLLAGGWRSYELSRAVGVEPPGKDAAHTALGDARWARAVHDAVTVPDAYDAASDEQLAAMVPAAPWGAP